MASGVHAGHISRLSRHTSLKCRQVPPVCRTPNTPRAVNLQYEVGADLWQNAVNHSKGLSLASTLTLNKLRDVAGLPRRPHSEAFLQAPTTRAPFTAALPTRLHAYALLQRGRLLSEAGAAAGELPPLPALGPSSCVARTALASAVLPAGKVAHLAPAAPTSPTVSSPEEASAGGKQTPALKAALPVDPQLFTRPALAPPQAVGSVFVLWSFASGWRDSPRSLLLRSFPPECQAEGPTTH